MGRQRRFKRMQRGVVAAAALLDQKLSTACRPWFVTLTYAPDAEHRQKQVAEYLRCVRRWAQRGNHAFGYTWVLELTKKGRPHYHVVFWLSRGVRMPKGDTRGWWPHGSTQTQRARNPVGYLVAYSKKAKECELPRGARLFGCGGLSLEDRRSKSWRLLPAYVRAAFDVGDDVCRVRGGGYASRTTGAFLAGARLIYYGHHIWAVGPGVLQ